MNCLLVFAVAPVQYVDIHYTALGSLPREKYTGLARNCDGDLAAGWNRVPPNKTFHSGVLDLTFHSKCEEEALSSAKWFDLQPF